jgi:hypothetical protein
MHTARDESMDLGLALLLQAPDILDSVLYAWQHFDSCRRSSTKFSPSLRKLLLHFQCRYSSRIGGKVRRICMVSLNKIEREAVVLTSIVQCICWHGWAEDNMIKGHRCLNIDGLEEPFQELHSLTVTLLVENEDASPWPVSC